MEVIKKGLNDVVCYLPDLAEKAVLFLPFQTRQEIWQQFQKHGFDAFYVYTVLQIIRICPTVMPFLHVIYTDKSLPPYDKCLSLYFLKGFYDLMVQPHIGPD